MKAARTKSRPEAQVTRSQMKQLVDQACAGSASVNEELIERLTDVTIYALFVGYRIGSDTAFKALAKQRNELVPIERDTARTAIQRSTLDEVLFGAAYHDAEERNRLMVTLCEEGEPE